MTYAYARVSTKDQNEARQVDAFRAAGIANERIYVDHESGKDFDRKNYKRIRRMIKHGDLLVVQSLDRFGRNYDMIIDEWRYITKTVGADVRVLDMPILDTTNGSGLVGRFVSDIVLQILSFVAENERTKIRERQAQGIKAAHARGVRFGRPRVDFRTAEFEQAKSAVASGVSVREASKNCGLSQSTFRRRLREAGVNSVFAKKANDETSSAQEQVMGNELKKCVICGKPFKTHNSTARCCSKICADRKRRGWASLDDYEKAHAERKARSERDTFGLTLAQRQEVIDAQDGDPSLLWKRSQTWTMNQRNFAKKRYLEMHDVLSHA